ncbi:EMILIN-2-like [Mytilus edulis]|uniref:EMILIN-2-like n=1 Tax=Mytilus edulis TaxID=6550 RepID=UPI0039EE0E48
MYFEVIFLVSVGSIYSEKCNNPFIMKQTKTEVDFLSKRLTALQGKLSSCKGEPPVSSYTAFTAILSTNGATMSSGGVVKYSRVLANIGNCYDYNTGVFTVKTPGVYSVSASMMTPPGKGVDIQTHMSNAMAKIRKRSINKQ